MSEVGFPIQKSTDQSLFAAPHGLSQRTTSFIASQCQGIHRTPLRHLIALMIDAHPSAEVAQVLIALWGIDRKNQLASRSCRDWRSGTVTFEFATAAPEGMARTGKIASSRYRTTRRTTRWPDGKTLSLLRTGILVEPDGIEPTTSCLQSTRSPS